MTFQTIESLIFYTKVFKEEEFSKLKKIEFVRMAETEYDAFEIFLNKEKNKINVYKRYFENNKYYLWYIELLEKLPEHWQDDPEEIKYRIVFKVARDPRNLFRIFEEVKRTFKNTKENKNTIINDLTDEEIEDIKKYFYNENN